MGPRNVHDAMRNRVRGIELDKYWLKGKTSIDMMDGGGFGKHGIWGSSDGVAFRRTTWAMEYGHSESVCSQQNIVTLCFYYLKPSSFCWVVRMLLQWLIRIKS